MLSPSNINIPNICKKDKANVKPKSVIRKYVFPRSRL